MKKKNIKNGVKVYHFEFPEQIGEIIETGNDYIHIHFGDEPFSYKTSKAPLTIDWGDVKDYRRVK